MKVQLPARDPGGVQGRGQSYPPTMLPSSQPSPASRTLSPQTSIHTGPQVAWKPSPESAPSDVKRNAIEATPTGVRKVWSAVPVMLLPICCGAEQKRSLHENTCGGGGRVQDGWVRNLKSGCGSMDQDFGLRGWGSGCRVRASMLRHQVSQIRDRGHGSVHVDAGVTVPGQASEFTIPAACRCGGDPWPPARAAPAQHPAARAPTRTPRLLCSSPRLSRQSASPAP